MKIVNLSVPAVGLVLQKVAYNSFNDQKSMEEVMDRKKKISQIGTDWWIDQEMLLDESFQNYWLLTMQNHNELGTLRLLKMEAERLMSDPNYTPCP